MPNIESVGSTQNVVVGLFGTCGNSTWRKDVIKILDENEVYYFNPQKDDWKDEYAKIEAEHLANDEVILLPITKDTYGSASLAEVGLSIKEISDSGRKVVLYIEPDLLENLNDDKARSESLVARTMLITRLPEIAKNMPNVHIVGNLDELSQKAIELAKEEKNITHGVELGETAQVSSKETVIFDFDASDSYVAKMAEMSLDITAQLAAGKKVMIHVERIAKPEKTDPDFINKDESRRARNIVLEHLEKITSKNSNLVLCTKEQIHDAKLAYNLHEAVETVPGRIGVGLDDITHYSNKGIGE